MQPQLLNLGIIPRPTVLGVGSGLSECLTSCAFYDMLTRDRPESLLCDSRTPNEYFISLEHKWLIPQSRAQTRITTFTFVLLNPSLCSSHLASSAVAMLAPSFATLLAVVSFASSAQAWFRIACGQPLVEERYVRSDGMSMHCSLTFLSGWILSSTQGRPHLNMFIAYTVVRVSTWKFSSSSHCILTYTQTLTPTTASTTPGRRTAPTVSSPRTCRTTGSRSCTSRTRRRSYSSL
jgi:hypothetical protein